MAAVDTKIAANRAPAVREHMPPPGLAGVAEALAADLLFDAPPRAEVVELVRRAASELSLPALDASLLLHRLVARDPLFLRVEPEAAIDALLRALLLFSPLSNASLWMSGGSAPPVCIASVGAMQPRGPIRRAAARALRGSTPNGAGEGSGPIRSVAVRMDDGRAALVVHTRPSKARAGLAHAGEAATALAPVLDRRVLLDSLLQSMVQVLEAVDRRVTRFGFDLHDGPLQRLSLLSGELTLLRRQLPQLAPDDLTRSIAERRVSDLVEMTTDVTQELRDLARSVSSRGTESIEERVDRTVREFEARAGASVDVRIEGAVNRVTDSQRIAVLRVMEESLANVAEHSRAKSVHLVLCREPDALRLTVSDDGRGFEVDRTLRTAARGGKLGLVSMRERVRMLGGTLEIESRRGGPTVVSAVVPAWDPRKPAG